MVEENDNSKKQHRVMVVEDNRHSLYLINFMLERAGYQTLVAEDGQQAQAMLRNEAPVDLLLVDLMLPYVSGYQIIMDAKEDEAWRDVPIIVLSGKSLETDIVEALQAGANDYVTKPYQPDELLARIRRTIATHDRMAEVIP